MDSLHEIRSFLFPLPIVYNIPEDSQDDDDEAGK